MLFTVNDSRCSWNVDVFAERVRNKFTKTNGIQLGFEPKTFWILLRCSWCHHLLSWVTYRIARNFYEPQWVSDVYSEGLGFISQVHRIFFCGFTLSKNIIIQLTSHHGLIETRCHEINSDQTNCHQQVNCHEIILQQDQLNVIKNNNMKCMYLMSSSVLYGV